jgi:transposase
MRQRSGTSKPPAEKVVKDIRRRRASSIRPRRRSASCWKACAARRASPSCAGAKGSPQSLYYSWSKEFLEAGKKRLAGDTAREATSPEVKGLRAEAVALKEAVADLTLENRLLKKSMLGDGGDDE